MAQLGTCPDALAISSPDRLQFSACSYVSTAISVSRRLTQVPATLLGPYWQSVIMLPTSPSGHGVVRRSFNMQIILCPLTSLGTTVGRCPCPSFSTVILLNLLYTDSSKVMVVLARTVAVLSSVYTELGRKGLPNLLHSDISTETLPQQDQILSLHILPPQLETNPKQLHPNWLIDSENLEF